MYYGAHPATFRAFALNVGAAKGVVRAEETSDVEERKKEEERLDRLSRCEAVLDDSKAVLAVDQRGRRRQDGRRASHRCARARPRRVDGRTEQYRP